MYGTKGKRFPSRDSKVHVKSSTRTTKHGIVAVKGYDRAKPSTTSGTVTTSNIEGALKRRERTKAIRAARNAALSGHYGGKRR